MRLQPWAVLISYLRSFLLLSSVSLLVPWVSPKVYKFGVPESRLANISLVGRVGYYLPFAVVSGVLTILGAGLISTFTPTTAVGTWIGFQIIMGAGRGLGFQMPIIAVQNNSSKEEVSIVNALVVFAQNLGGAVFLSVDQIIFSSRLRHYLAIYAPEINPQVVIAAGATRIREAVPSASLPGVLLAYSKSFDRVMYLGIGAAGGALLAAFGMGWVNIKKQAEIVKVEASTPEP
jgi:hypothetical protein